MDHRPLIAYLVFIIFYRVLESFSSIRAGSWKRKPKLDWTLFMIVGSFILIIIGAPLEYLLFNSQPELVNYLSGGVLFALGAFFRAKGLLDLKKGFSMGIERIEGQELVETGLYRRIRHPLYLGTLCVFLACPLFLDAHISFALAAVGMISVNFRIRAEEIFLSEHMPGYREYMKRTWKMIPGVF